MLARNSDPITSHAGKGARVREDFVGLKFGRLTVTARAANIGQLRAWSCLCECGSSTVVRGKDLKSGNTRSCGCLLREARAVAGRKNVRHGMTSTPTWESWQSMLRRCDTPTHKSYKDYGGRGIKVCARWYSFSAFLEDMGERPDGMTLDRWPDLNGDYEPGNCRWATPTQQNCNRRSNVHLVAFGEKKVMVEWARDARCLVPATAFEKRIYAGWPVEVALTKPIRETGAQVRSDTGRAEREWEAV